MVNETAKRRTELVNKVVLQGSPSLRFESLAS